ncbi:hypothetical protein BSG8_02000 [Bacillus subtilis subsp. natto]|nr:hypothetical protein BsBEST3136_02070 [Bacillus subtilis]BCV98812.1 hypothetical protein BsBEST3145_02080 [Bacillus subtilis]BDB91448.1 hypothetical protein BSG8_02000 [Bacillus subtilis subsp. natto]BEH04177.1 hypothetical protein BSNN_02100 [Bacillus subtilis subsp. natto]
MILIYSHEPYLLLAFAILFGLVDFATVAPTQMLATQYFQNYSIGLMIGWLSLAHQIGSALGAYVPGVIYTVTGEYTLAFYLSIGMLVLASVMNVMLREPAAVTRDSAAVVDK